MKYLSIAFNLLGLALSLTIMAICIELPNVELAIGSGFMALMSIFNTVVSAIWIDG